MLKKATKEILVFATKNKLKLLNIEINKYKVFLNEQTHIFEITAVKSTFDNVIL